MNIRLVLNFAIFLLLFTACKNDEPKADNSLGFMEVEIPNNLKSKEEVVAYINSMSQIIDDYAMKMDRILDEFDDYVGDGAEEMGMIEKMKMASVILEFGSKSSDFQSQFEDLQQQKKLFEKELKEDEIDSLNVFSERFEQRMMQIISRHPELFNDTTNKN